MCLGFEPASNFNFDRYPSARLNTLRLLYSGWYVKAKSSHPLIMQFGR